MAQRKTRNSLLCRISSRTDKRSLFRKFNANEASIISRTSFLLAVLLLTWITFGNNGILRLLEVKKELRTTEIRKENLQGENARLKKEIARIQDDPEYLEEVARQRYYLTKKNEVLFRFD